MHKIAARSLNTSQLKESTDDKNCNCKKLLMENSRFSKVLGAYDFRNQLKKPTDDKNCKLTDRYLTTTESVTNPHHNTVTLVDGKFKIF